MVVCLGFLLLIEISCATVLLLLVMLLLVHSKPRPGRVLGKSQGVEEDQWKMLSM